MLPGPKGWGLKSHDLADLTPKQGGTNAVMLNIFGVGTRGQDMGYMIGPEDVYQSYDSSGHSQEVVGGGGVLRMEGHR